MKKNTIAEVAQEAGVSVPTVSRVLNKRPDVAPETRKRVEEVIDRLGFQPNAVARSLDSNETRTVALIYLHYEPQGLFADPYLAGVTSGIIDVLTADGYYLVTLPIADLEDSPNTLKEFLRSGRVDGVIVHNANIDDPFLEIIGSSHLPYVVLDQEKPLHDWSVSVSSDHASGIYQLVDYLVRKGHRSIGLIYGDLRRFAGSERANAFRKALADHNLEVREKWIRGGAWYLQGGVSGMNSILDEDEKPTAVMASTDLMAMGAIELSRTRGLMVPVDIAITGFDDVPFARYLNPPLTTVRLPYGEFGGIAAGSLLGLIKKEEIISRSILVPVRLVIGESA